MLLAKDSAAGEHGSPLAYMHAGSYFGALQREISPLPAPPTPLQPETRPRAPSYHHLHTPAIAGELAALLGGQRHQSFMALTHCFLYSLKHDALEGILQRCVQCTHRRA